MALPLILSKRRKFKLREVAINPSPSHPTLTLIQALQTIPDHRRGAGQRYPLWVFLLLMILGTMSGYRGYRGLSRFMLRHQEQLAERLGLRRAQLPSYATIRRL